MTKSVQGQIYIKRTFTGDVIWEIGDTLVQSYSAVLDITFQNYVIEHISDTLLYKINGIENDLFALGNQSVTLCEL